MEHWKLNIIGYCIIGAGCLIEKGQELRVWFKRYSKMHAVSCTNTHHGITDLVNHGIVENIKT